MSRVYWGELDRTVESSERVWIVMILLLVHCSMLMALQKSNRQFWVADGSRSATGMSFIERNLGGKDGD